jgi:alkylhydroperoxidase family enzyme
MTARVLPLDPPYAPDVDASLRRMMPEGSPIPPLALFRTLARHRPLSDAMHALGSYVLGKKADRALALPSRIRELVILRVTARCGCEYEWGVHATAFGARVGLSAEQIAATVTGDGTSGCFSGEDAAIVAAIDELHDRGRVSDATWARCGKHLGPEQLLELLTVAGWYHAISFVANGAQVELEPWAARFPS